MGVGGNTSSQKGKERTVSYIAKGQQSDKERGKKAIKTVGRETNSKKQRERGRKERQREK